MLCGASMEDLRPDPLIGRVVGGAYLLRELIGVGGMGRVYRAEQNMLGRTVAVKVIHPHLLGDPQTVARFCNEARAASRLNHPNSVSVIDFGRTDDGVLYLVMEHLAGKDLSQTLDDEAPLPFGRICRVLRAIVSALGEAHSLGVVHRDLKPENVIVRRVRRGAEQVKVVDFGLAHIVGPGGTSITSPGLVCGTPDFMSPEQGRGEDVDGRGDLYAVGVVLFVMLTERLPYEADTPTQIVLKHLHDPIPDPRDVAPHRAIPDELAQICIKAMQKKREARFQSADELGEALRVAEERIEGGRASEVSACVVCGAPNPSAQRFCGACGGRLTARFAVPPSLRSGSRGRPGSAPPPPGAGRIVGREEELERLVGLRDRAREGRVLVRLVGEAGVGKTRFMQELGTILGQQGDSVIEVGPHPSGVAVPYWPIRQLVRGLLGVDDAELRQLAESRDVTGDPIARAGVAELLEPEGLEGCPGTSRAHAVTVALAAAVRVAQGRSRSGGVALMVDDLSRCDALSAEVIQRLMDRGEEGGLFVVVASSPRRDPLHGGDSIRMILPGLEPRDASELLYGPPEVVGALLRELDAVEPGRPLLPLHLEQLRALGASSSEEEASAPPRLPDAVMARLERLDLAARRMLQAIAVLGESAPWSWVQALGRAEDVPALGRLLREGLVSQDGDVLRFCHPFVRELVASSIPVEHRKALHALALDITAEAGAPLEVRAEHAWRAGEPTVALMLLERTGDAALRRGDGSAAVLAFRRGLELARRELSLTGDTALDRAIVAFSRKLGDAMDWAGDPAGADGVLREALDLAEPTNRERGKMLVLLARVAARRNRPREGARLLGQALEQSVRLSDRLGEGEAHLALGKQWLAEGDTLTAANALQQALEAFEGEKRAAALVVEAALARSEALAAIGDSEFAEQSLERALDAARACGARCLLARVLAARAAAAEAARDRARASSLYREAYQVAAEAGDAEGARRWQRLGRGSDVRRVG